MTSRLRHHKRDVDSETMATELGFALKSRAARHAKAHDILPAEQNRADDKYEKNIAMTDCLLAGNSITRQSVIAIIILFVVMVCSFSPPSVRA